MTALSDDSQPLISIIVPTFRRFEPLLNTLDDLLRQDWQTFEILVMDQNPNWPAEFLSRKEQLIDHPRIRWVQLKTPGVVAARNQAASAARGSLFVFVDDDVEIRDSGFLRKHADNYHDASIVGVAGRECRRGTKSTEVELHHTGRKNEVRPFPIVSRLDAVFLFSRDSPDRVLVNTFCTCNGSIQAATLRQLGGFDENFTGNSYGDDYDLALRAADEGLTIVYDPGCWLVHLQSPLGGLRLSDQANPSNERDRAISACMFVVKHFEWRYAYRLIVDHLLRKTVLRRDNVVRPWRQPAAWYGLISGLIIAVRRHKRGPKLPLRHPLTQ